MIATAAGWGKVYLGEMPQKDQQRMTDRLTKVIRGTIQGSGERSLKLRYVADAGCLRRKYFRQVLAQMKHPQTGAALNWSWGVDFYHVCEYLGLLADALFGAGTGKSETWFRNQRHSLRHDRQAIAKIRRQAAQQRRRHGLQGCDKAYHKAVSYLTRYGPFMDFAERRKAGDPIGSGVTEAGCKVIFNQRMKQSGMRWSQSGGQQIVDLRTACRSGLWDEIWNAWHNDRNDLPPLSQIIYKPARLAA